MFFDFQFRSLCGIARIPYAAGGLEQQVVELPPQNYSVAKILKKARLQGPVSGCQNQPKTGYVRRYLQSMPETGKTKGWSFCSLEQERCGTKAGKQSLNTSV